MSWYTATELAGLPGMPRAAFSVLRIAQREQWPGRQRAGSKAFEYPISRLPAVTQQAVQAQAIPDLPAPPPGAGQLQAVAQAPAQLAQWQREVAEARLAIVRAVEAAVPVLGKEGAVQLVLARAAAGTLPEPLQALVRTANAKAGEHRTLSRRRVYAWCSCVAGAGDQSPIALLAPATKTGVEVPLWAAPLLKAWSQPQKPPLTDVLESLKDVLPPEQMPSYSQANRFLKERMGKVDVMRGRMGSRELKNLRPFVRRDTSDLNPTDIYTADGHCFDAEVAHPKHGRAFRPEITSVLDVATRRAVGWSVDLAESRWAVLDALRAASEHGIAAIFYVDNGSGYVNDLMTREGTGLMARLGTTMKHSTPYNSQARGIIERFHQTVWVKAARLLPTYMGDTMDRQARQVVHKLTRKDIRNGVAPKALLPWAEFVRFAEAQVEAYNNRPHRGLPKITDPQTKKARHQTPNEAWAAALAAGYSPELPTAAEQEDMFRPYAVVRVTRGEIRLHGHRYFSRNLEQHHGDDVIAGYDIHDPACIWVRDLEGRAICRAELNGNSQRYFPKSVVDQAAEKRMRGRLKRAENQAEEIRLEQNPGRVLEHLESVKVPGLDLSRAALAQRAAALAEETDTRQAQGALATPRPFTAVAPLPAGEPRTAPETSQQRYARWLALDARVQAGDYGLTEQERNFWDLFPRSDLFQMLREQDNQEKKSPALTGLG